MDSILISIKKLLGITSEDTSFDTDIIIHINSVFLILSQIGIGPSSGFIVQDKNDAWSDFVGEEQNFELVKTYTYLKVKLLFDPPVSSALIESTNRQITEFEWRLQIMGAPTI